MDVADYRELLAELKRGLDGVKSASSFYSPLNVLPRLATGKWAVREIAGCKGFVNETGARLVPPPDPGDFYRAIIEWVQAHTVGFVPSYMADVLRQKGLKVTKIQTEYMMHPDRLRNLPGGRLRNRRYEVAQARKVARAVVIDPHLHAIELHDLTRRWYAEAKTRLWRPGEKTLIDWTIENWRFVKEVEPTATCAAVFDGFKMISFEMGAMLTSTCAGSFTQRSDREATHGKLAGANLLCSITLSEALGDVMINDGPADHKELAARKEALSAGTLDFYSVARR